MGVGVLKSIKNLSGLFLESINVQYISQMNETTLCIFTDYALIWYTYTVKSLILDWAAIAKIFFLNGRCHFLDPLSKLLHKTKDFGTECTVVNLSTRV